MAVYLSCVSSSLVAFGFFAAATHRRAPVVATVLPALLVLGVFTFVRMVETSVENMVFLRRIEAIRRYYATLDPAAAAFFGPAEDDSAAAALGFSPHHLNELRSFPKAYNNGRPVTDRWHLVHADFSARSNGWLEVRQDITQRSHSVSPRAREYEPAVIESPEIWPLKLSPRFFKSWKRPPTCHMPLSQRGHSPQSSCNIATGVKYSPAQLRDFAADTIVEDKGAQAATEEPKLRYAFSR
jgi:hypothetical protein